MSNGNGRIYTETVGGVAYGVSVWDIQKILGRSANDVGLLCSDKEWYDNSGTPALRPVNKMNKFAKFKPVRYPSITATKESVPTLYRGADNKCGMEIPVLTATDFADSDIEDTITDAPDYELLAPRGKDTNSEWFRILDFNGYDHYASMGFQFVPPTVSQAGYININGEHVFTLRVGNLYTKTGTASANVLSLVDLMIRFSDSGGNLYVYNSKSPQSWSASNDITNDLSYGFLGIILIYTSTVGSVPSVQVCMRSHSLGLNSADNNELAVDFTAVYDESGAPNPQNGDTVFLAPCFTNLNTEGEWVALISGTSYPLVKCGLFPKFPAGSSSVNFVSYVLYTPVPTLAVLSYSIYGATLVSGNTYRVSSSSASFLGITVTAGTGTLGENNTYKITNVNNSYSGASNNTLTGSLTFNSSRQASFQVNLKDGNNNSIFMNDYISLGIQILSPNGEYQNDMIQIFAYNA